MRFAITLTVAALALPVTPTALAQAPTGEIEKSQPGAAAHEALKVATITRTVTVDDQSGELPGTATRRHTVSLLAESTAGVNLWRYFHRVRFDYWGTPNIEGPLGNGRLSKPIRHSAWGEIYTYGWDWCCNIHNFAWGGDGDWKALRGKQGKFRLCPGPLGCIQTMTPWIKHKIRGDGWVKWWGGGA